MAGTLDIIIGIDTIVHTTIAVYGLIVITLFGLPSLSMSSTDI